MLFFSNNCKKFTFKNSRFFTIKSIIFNLFSKMAIKNIFELPLNATRAEITNFVLSKVWMWSDSSDRTFSVHIAVGDTEEEFYVSVDDVWRLKDLARIIYPQAKEELGYEIISKHYDEEDNCVGVREVVFRFERCSGCCLHS